MTHGSAQHAPDVLQAMSARSIPCAGVPPRRTKRRAPAGLFLNRNGSWQAFSDELLAGTPPDAGADGAGADTAAAAPAEPPARPVLHCGSWPSPCPAPRL